MNRDTSPTGESASRSVRQQTAAITLLRAADEYQNTLMRLLRGFDLTPSQYHVLRILRNEPRALPVLEIASRLIQVVPAITGLIRRLEQANLVERSRGQQDRRVIYIRLTAAGSERLDAIDEPICDLYEKLLGHLSDAELDELTRLTNRAREVVVDPKTAARPHDPEPIPAIGCDD